MGLTQQSCVLQMFHGHQTLSVEVLPAVPFDLLRENRLVDPFFKSPLQIAPNTIWGGGGAVIVQAINIKWTS
jgi:hypothetical protein